MNIRRTTATLLAVATLTVGFGVLAAPAGAQTTDTTAPPKVCEIARADWAKLVVADHRAREQYADLRARQAWLESHGHTDAAAQLDARLDRLRTVHARLVDRAQQLREKYESRCGTLGDDVDPSALA